jgi:outer membrane cobalamin receptor
LHVSLMPKLNWKVTDKFGADIFSTLTFSNSTFTGLQQSRFFLDVTPTVTFKADKLTAQGGIKVNSFTGTTNKFAAYPVLKAKYQVLPEKLSVTAGLGGEMRYLKYYDLIEQNRYLNRTPDIRPSRDAIHIYAGVDGQLAKYFSYSARFYTKQVKDQLIYFNPENAAYFQMLYDSSFQQTGAELSLIFNKNDKVRAGIKGDFRAFKTNQVAANFGIPGTKVDIWGSYNFANKVWVATEIYVFGPRTMSMTSDSIPVAIEQGIVADVNLSAEYRFSKRLSVFLELNNLLDNRWQRWYNYQERPFDIKGGLTFSF